MKQINLLTYSYTNILIAFQQFSIVETIFMYLTPSDLVLPICHQQWLYYGDIVRLPLLNEDGVKSSDYWNCQWWTGWSRHCLRSWSADGLKRISVRTLLNSYDKMSSAVRSWRWGMCERGNFNATIMARHSIRKKNLIMNNATDLII